MIRCRFVYINPNLIANQVLNSHNYNLQFLNQQRGDFESTRLKKEKKSYKSVMDT